MTVMAVLNIILDYVFLYGFHMGVFGAALASVIATFAAVFVGFFFLCDKKSGFRFGVCLRTGHDGYKEYIAIAKNGSPAALNNLMQTVRILTVNYLLGLYGNTLYIAMFVAVNCISEFSLCLIQGIPQAASAMLGIYYGERDNGSARILMRLQWQYGRVYTLIFGLLITAGSGVIAKLYGLAVPMLLPMLWLALSIFPALINGIFSGCYNVSEHAG